MKIINNHILPFGKNYIAINLFGVVFAKRRLSERDQNHEHIHTYQQLEMLFVFFFIWYVIEWFVRVIQYRGWEKGYLQISFEREAYSNEHNLHYLHHRKPFAWLKYLVGG